MSKNKKVVLGFFSLILMAEMVFVSRVFPREMVSCEPVLVHEKVKTWMAVDGVDYTPYQANSDLVAESLSRTGVYIVLTPQTPDENSEFSRYDIGDKLLICDQKDKRIVLKK